MSSLLTSRYTRRGRALAAAVVTGLLIVVAAVPAGALAAIDQSQVLASGQLGTCAGGQWQLAQTFTPSRTGMLEQVDLHLEGPIDAVANLEIRETDVNGLPTSSVLDSAPVALPGVGAWTSAVLSSETAGNTGPAVTAGRTYAIVVWTDCGDGSLAASYQPSVNAYAGGRALSSPDGVAWTTLGSGDDLAFRTFITHGLLDQEPMQGGGPPEIFCGANWLAQTVTPGRTGTLSQVDLALASTHPADQAVTVEIRPLSAGVPTSPVLATEVVNVVSTSSGNHAIVLAPGAPVVAGVPFAIVVRGDCGASGEHFVWFRAMFGPYDMYPAGTWMRTGDGGGSWSGLGLDARFTTYVTPAAYDFAGFAAPVDNATPNSAKAGQAIPVRYHLELDGVPVSDPASFERLTSNAGTGSCTGDNADAVETYVNASGLKYLGGGNWQFNWAVPKSYKGQCRTMTLELSDDSTHTASFIFK